MTSLKTKIEMLEKEEIIRALDECDWVKIRAARSLGITERMIGYKINKYNISKEESVCALTEQNRNGTFI